MKTGLGSQAFTIVEILIVLAVSAALLVSAFALISGQQAKTQFGQSINDIQSQINSIISNANTGYYNNTNNFSCTSDGISGPQLTSGVNDQGTNQGCIFIGRAIQFGVKNTSGEGFNVYNLVGQRQVSVAGVLKDVANLSDSWPTALAPASTSPPGFPDSTEVKTLLYGLQAKTIKYTPATGGVPIDIGTIAFATDFPQISGGTLSGGSRTVQLYAISNSVNNELATDAVDHINATSIATNNFIQADNATICFEGGVNQHGTVTIGGQNRQLNTTLAIANGGCP